MRDSDTFQAVLDEGREQEARKLIVRFAPERLGPPDEQTTTRLEAIADLERLERLLERVVRHGAEVADWGDLLETP